jgi:NADP-reducing hydrogenase subunit HndD
MEVFTNTPRVLESRKKTLQLILSDHNQDCLGCVRRGNCELQTLCKELGVDNTEKYHGAKNQHDIDDSAVHMIRDNSKCILCRRCSAACANVQGIGVIGANNRGFATEIGCAFEKDLSDTACVNCGQCIAVCPTGALYEKSAIDDVLAAIADPEKHVVVQAAPAVRAALGEEFGFPMGTPVQGKLAAALRRIGFDKVFDTNFSADLTIMEEANELLERINKGGKLPMITSCSPGWIKYCEHYFPEMTENLSTCKSPQQMFGAVTKTYYAEKMGWDPKSIVCVSIMPCTAKKFELTRDDQAAAGVPDIDYSMTTRELAGLIKRMGIDFNSLPNEGFDSPLGSGSGAAVIFGATGGVMEAAVRTANAWLNGADQPLELMEVRGTERIKEVTVNLAGNDYKICVASSASAAKEVMDKLAAGNPDGWGFIEIMGCPGGCVNGGGQPIQPQYIRDTVDLKSVRAKALYDQDKGMELRMSHESPLIKKIYEEWYTDGFGGHKAHHDLHTSYTPRKKYN